MRTTARPNRGHGILEFLGFAFDQDSVDIGAGLRVLIGDGYVRAGVYISHILVFDILNGDNKVLPGYGLVVDRKTDAILLDSTKQIFLSRFQPHALPLEEVTIRLKNPHIDCMARSTTKAALIVFI